MCVVLGAGRCENGTVISCCTLSMPVAAPGDILVVWVPVPLSMLRPREQLKVPGGAVGPWTPPGMRLVMHFSVFRPITTQAGVQHRRVESPESVDVETMSLAVGPFRRKVEAKQLTRTRGLALHLLPFFVVKLIAVPYALISAVPGTRFEISSAASQPGRLLDIYLLHKMWHLLPGARGTST